MTLLIKISLLLSLFFKTGDTTALKNADQGSTIDEGKEMLFMPDSTVYNFIINCENADYQNPKCLYSGYDSTFYSFSPRTNPQYYKNFRKNKKGEYEYIGKEKISKLVLFEKSFDSKNNVPLSAKNLESVKHIYVYSELGLPNNIGNFTSVQKIYTITTNELSSYPLPICLAIPESFYKLHQLYEFHSTRYYLFDAKKVIKMPNLKIIYTNGEDLPLSDFVFLLQSSIAFDLGRKTSMDYKYAHCLSYIKNIKFNLANRINTTSKSIFFIGNQKFYSTKVDENKTIFFTCFSYDSLPGMTFADYPELDYEKKFGDSAKLEIEYTNKSISKISLNYSLMRLTEPAPTSKEDIKRKMIVEFTDSNISILDFSFKKVDTVKIVKHGNDIIFSKKFDGKIMTLDDSRLTYDLKTEMFCEYKNLMFDTLYANWNYDLETKPQPWGYPKGEHGELTISKKEVMDGLPRKKKMDLTNVNFR